VSEERGRLIAGRYRLGRLLGQGGMGFVWHAHDQVLDREVAVKEVFVPDHNEDRSERAFREARAAGRLNHPGIVTIHDLVSDEGRSWIVMELVRAPSLEAALRESGPMAPGRVARIGLALLEALRAAHEAGILHRDIKPGNVLLPGDRAVITDFGIATIRGDEKLTATGQVVGTPAYMPPERLRGEPASEASDMWALGATLYAAVTGHPPGAARTSAGTSAGMGPLAPALEGLLRDDPGARLTAGQASALLESLSAGLAAGTGPAQTRLDVPPGPRGASAGWWHRRSSRLVAAAAGLAAVVTAVLLAVTLSSGAPASHGQARATFSPATTPTTVGCASARWRTTRRRPRQNSSSASAALPVTCTAWPGTSPSPAYFVQMTALSASWQSWQSVFSVFFATFRPS
jgi:serine/threonine protein kinase